MKDKKEIFKKDTYVIYSPYQAGMREIFHPSLKIRIEDRDGEGKVVLLDYKAEKSEKTDS